MKKISQIGVIILIISITIGFSINYVFYEPTEINAFVASKTYKEGVVNPAFDDENFYKCVVEVYNDENGTSHPYTYNLNDDELMSITYLDCSEKKISSVKGLEKMQSLKYLYIYDNQLTSLDVSKNTALISLDLRYNQLTSLDVSKNTLLSHLYVYENQLTELDVSNNTLLGALWVSSNKLVSLTLGENKKLYDLRVNHNDLIELDVSKNPALTFLAAQYNQLMKLDVSNNILLTSLNLESNNLKEIDLSNNLLLEHLWLCSNEFLSLDLSFNTKLTWLQIYGNPFKNDIYVYKNNNFQIEGNVKFSRELNWGKINWNSEDSEIATVDSNGLVSALKVGNTDIAGNIGIEYVTRSTVNVVEITSDKYIIDEKQNLIHVGIDNDVDIIKENVDISHKEIDIKVDLYNNKLQVKYNDSVLKEFDITGEYIFFDEDIKVDDKYLSNIMIGSGVRDIISKIDTNGIVTVTNNKNEVITGDKLIGTDSKISIKLSSKTIEYQVIIQGDIDGDGELKLGDIMKLANYLYKDKKSLNSVYLLAADYDGNGIYHLQDIMKIANKIYGGGN